MKIALLSLIFLAATAFGAIGHFWFGKTLSAAEAEQRWGKQEFSIADFKASQVGQRSKMTATLIRRKKEWIGKPISEVEKQLGKYDGYYFTDWIPAYIINVRKDEKDDLWQIVFLPDTEEKVKDIIIHKNCCDY